MTCRVCSSSSTCELPFHNYHFKSASLFDGLSIIACENCGFGEVFQSLPTDKLIEFYEKEYRAKNSLYYYDYANQLPVPDPFSISQILNALFYLKPKQKGSFLDVGAGHGGSFAAVNLFLPHWDLYVNELNPDALRYFQRTYHTQLFDDRDPRKMDLILMSHVLEHFQGKDVMGQLLKIHSALAEDGVFILEVPNNDMRTYQKFRGNHTPHITFFSQQSLTSLVQKAGFQVLYVTTLGSPIRYDEDDAKTITGRSLSVRIKSMVKSLFSFLRPWIVKKRTNEVLNGVWAQSIFKFNNPEGTCLRMILRKQ